ncbi:MAG: hypothetical protein HGGPFJEG_01507 [Ignavibacteria bacterium]|nr:hypothetical protein [Ignavibacteria bacterium]
MDKSNQRNHLCKRKDVNVIIISGNLADSFKHFLIQLVNSKPIIKL